MRGILVFGASLVVSLLLGSADAAAGGMKIHNTSDTQLPFFTQGVMPNGSATKWKLWHLKPHHHLGIHCTGCVSFNFEIRTKDRHPVKYKLDLDKTYKLRFNSNTKKWDLFQ